MKTTKITLMQKLFPGMGRIFKRLNSLILGILVFVAFTSQAQEQYEKWQFGFGGIIGFMPNAVSGTPGSAIAASEGCATWNDPATGNRIYYTDGRTIWNGMTNAVIFAGLNGTPNAIGSATQGVIIVPIGPCLHYIYTISDVGTINIGISQWAYNPCTGLILSGPTCPANNYATTEMITAVPGCNPSEFWLVVKPVSNNPLVYPTLCSPGPALGAGGMSYLLAYRITAAGIANVPVATPTPEFVTGGIGTADYIGTMKFSPNREYFAVAERETWSGGPGHWGNIHVYRFDRSMGTFNHIMSWTQNSFTYGISFSPNSNVIYAQHGLNIRAYNMEHIFANSCPNDDLPLEPEFTFYPSDVPSGGGTARYFQLEIGQDDRVYWAKPTTNQLGAFFTPNNYLAPTHTPVAVTLDPGQTCSLGLPNNICSLNPRTREFQYCASGCNKVCLNFVGSCQEIPTAPITWDFGDGTIITGGYGLNIPPGSNTTGTYDRPCHTYSTNTGTSVVPIQLSIGGVVQSTHFVTLSTINNWHQQTNLSSATSLKDEGNDVVIDAENNVYVCGTYYGSAKFFDSINPEVIVEGNAAGTAYLAKYNSCGELQWVNYDDVGMSTGASIAIDETRGMIYMTGKKGSGGSVRFLSSAACPVGCTPVSGTPITVGMAYVAGFNMSNGNLVNTRGINSSSLDITPTSIYARNLSATTTDLYVCGYDNVVSGSLTIDRGFVFSLVAAATISPGWGPNYTTNTTGFVRPMDLTLNTSDDRLYIVGNFKSTFAYSGSPSLTAASTVTTEAFAFAVTRTTGAFPAGGLMRRSNMVGTSVDARNCTAQSIAYNSVTNQLYIAGSIDGSKTFFFGLGVGAVNATMSALGKKAYVIGINGNIINYKWQVGAVIPANGNVRGSGVTTTPDGSRVILYGDWACPVTASNLHAVAHTGTTHTMLEGIYTGPLSQNKLFMVAFDASPSVTTFWDNSTTSGAGGSFHTATKVAANNNFAIYTGKFDNDMNYNFTTGGTTVLNATSPGGNTFILKGDLTNNNSLKLQMTEAINENNADINIDENLFEVFVAPNPANGSVTVSTPQNRNEASLTINIIDVQGKLVISKQVSGSSNVLDVSMLENGIYIMQVSNGEKTSQIKIIKQN